MKDGLNLFMFNGHQVRVVVIDCELWFVAKDVCDVLGIMNASDKVRKRLEEDELRIYSIYTETKGGKAERKMLFMSESGLYKFLMRSDKPEAREFQNWVTRDVLPAIRKTGSYTMLQEAEHVAGNNRLELSEAADGVEVSITLTGDIKKLREIIGSLLGQ